MARPREHDREEAVDDATEVFWENGYEGTSVADIVAATGLHRRSLYDEFGGKSGLFLACIDHYSLVTVKDLIALLERQPLGLANIRAFFRNRVDYVSSGHSKGCLIGNTAIEKERVSKEASDKVRYFFGEIENGFSRCLQAAQNDGDIDKDKDCKVLGNYLMCFLEGLLVVGKTNPSKESVESIVEAALSAVEW